MRTIRTGATSAVVLGAAVWSFAAGCGDDDSEGAGDREADVENVNVVLSEWIVEPEPASVRAGEITFVADNQGGETHELLVVRAASTDDLPLADDGSLDEEALGEENLLGEVEDVASGEKEELTLDLAPGNYVLLCNVVEEPGEMEMEPGTELSHLANGMSADLTVE